MILATNPNMEGETTALYLIQALQPLGVKVTRLASGLPVGRRPRVRGRGDAEPGARGPREVQPELIAGHASTPATTFPSASASIRKPSWPCSESITATPDAVGVSSAISRCSRSG